MARPDNVHRALPFSTELKFGGRLSSSGRTLVIGGIKPRAVQSEEVEHGRTLVIGARASG